MNKPDLEAGPATFDARKFEKTGGWPQDPIQAALLGLTDAARAAIVQNFSNHGTGRFPVSLPDQANGSVASMTLQSMLMQTEGSKIAVFPSWPKDWDVEFKLHAPQNTVTPEKRYADVRP
jgi:alpha-L-fucosidase 2